MALEEMLEMTDMVSGDLSLAAQGVKNGLYALLNSTRGRADPSHRQVLEPAYCAWGFNLLSPVGN